MDLPHYDFLIYYISCIQWFSFSTYPSFFNGSNSCIRWFKWATMHYTRSRLRCFWLLYDGCRTYGFPELHFCLTNLIQHSALSLLLPHPRRLTPVASECAENGWISLQMPLVLVSVLMLMMAGLLHLQWYLLFLTHSGAVFLLLVLSSIYYTGPPHFMMPCFTVQASLDNWWMHSPAITSYLKRRLSKSCSCVIRGIRSLDIWNVSYWDLFSMGEGG